MSYQKGQEVTYQILDEVNYSRGYGIYYETKTSTIREICYRMENGDLITVRNIQRAEAPEKGELKNEPQKK